MSEIVASHILIATDMQNAYDNLVQKLSTKSNRVIGFIRDKFLLEDAKAVVAESYISESNTKFIIMGASEFHSVAQNSLLKIIEEPPKNTAYIIISPTKSNLLPTIRSRLPIFNTKEIKIKESINFSLSKLAYEQIFIFLKENAYTDKNRAKLLIEALFHRATVIDMLILTFAQLNNFDRAYKLLELNAKPQSVFAMILMGFTQE